VVASEVFGLVQDYTDRLIRLATVLVDVHLDIAMREVAWEKKRLTSGSILLAIGGGLMAMFGLLFQAIAIVWLQSLTGSWLQAMLIVAGLDFLLGSVFLLAAARKLRGPYMVQTQARMARTAATLMQTAPDGIRARDNSRPM
jgi:hypothetical protein